MDDKAGYLVLLAVLAYIGYWAWRGYHEAESPALPMRDTGNGVMEPVCPYCNARLITITRRSGSGLLGVLAILLGVVGFVLLLVNWIAGGIMLIFAVLLGMAGKSNNNVLTCPACSKYQKIIE